MSASLLFVVRRCDGFYRFWHDVTDPIPIWQAHAVYDELTRRGTRNTKPDDADYYEIFAADPLPGWCDVHPPLVRRLHQQDAPAINAHLLRLNTDDRRLRFFREATDMQIRAYVRDIDWDHSLLLGAICRDRVVGMAEALFGRTFSPHHAEIAVSVDADLRGRGLGGFLVGHAVDRVGLLGVRQTSFSFLRENRSIQRITRTLGGRVDMEDLVGTITTGAFNTDVARGDRRLAA
jgi:GNAT superfamily N-acetyltransferase